MAEIPLTQGRVAIVDDADYEQLSRWKWFAKWNPFTRSFYAARSVRRNGSVSTIKMHREILGLYPGDKREADHADHDTLNNTRSNLRVATVAQNRANKRLESRNTSGYKGVSAHQGKWRAQLWSNGTRHDLGTYETKDAAYAAYCSAAQAHFGEFACLR